MTTRTSKDKLIDWVKENPSTPFSIVWDGTGAISKQYAGDIVQKGFRPLGIVIDSYDIAAAAGEGDFHEVIVETGGLAGGVAGGLAGAALAAGTITVAFGYVPGFGQAAIFIAGVAGGIAGEKKTEEFIEYILSLGPGVGAEMQSYSLLGSATYTRWAQSQGLPLSNDYPIDLINGGPKCFPSNTPILLASGEMRAICAVRAGDLILAFDGAADLGRGALVPKRVTRLYRNETTEWVRLSCEEDGVARELVVTPGHRFLTAHGTFEQIGDMAAGGQATVVLADGRLTDVVAERIVYSAETAGLFELGRTFDNSNCIKAA